MLALISVALVVVGAKVYEPSWDDLKTRPLPSWFDEAKVGIFIHWGAFSVPAFHGSNFWAKWNESGPDSKYNKFMLENYRPDWTYPDFASQFTAEFYDPVKWVKLFKDAGAK